MNTLLIISLVIGGIFVAISLRDCYRITRILHGWQNLIGILMGLLTLSLMYRISGLAIQIDPDSAVLAAFYSYGVPPAYSIGMFIFTRKLYKWFKKAGRQTE